MKMIWQTVLLILTVALCDATYSCQGTRGDVCQTYTIDCIDDFRLLRPFRFQRTCAGNTYFSEFYQRCIDPTTINVACTGISGEEPESDEITTNTQSTQSPTTSRCGLNSGERSQENDDDCSNEESVEN